MHQRFICYYMYLIHLGLEYCSWVPSYFTNTVPEEGGGGGGGRQKARDKREDRLESPSECFYCKPIYVSL